MGDRFKEAQLRDEIVGFVKKDLIGPSDEMEILNESPMFAYLTGMIYPKGGAYGDKSEQEIGFDVDMEESADYSQDDDEDDGQAMTVPKFKQQTSIGATFYLAKTAKSFLVKINWGDYSLLDEVEDEELDLLEYAEEEDVKKKKTHRRYQRYPHSETIRVDMDNLPSNKEYALKTDQNIKLKLNIFKLSNEYQVVSAFVSNERSIGDDLTDSVMFQVEMEITSENDLFFAENICRDSLAEGEYLYSQRPVFARGRGCSVFWNNLTNEETDFIKTTFIPEHEICGVSAAFEEFPSDYFSTLFFAKSSNKDKTVERLRGLTNSYEDWINKLKNDPKMSNQDFYNKVGRKTVDKCLNSLKRMNEGIDTLVNNPIAFNAFTFMNVCMRLQKNIAGYSKKHGQGIECNFGEFTNPSNPENDMTWYPFQIAFILMNVNSIVNPECSDREIVDLLYFPTGGGKTEAYLGLIAFTIAHRRMSRKPNDSYNKDGGVTAFLRYTLRLLTTQQRDRITRMIVAAEYLRRKKPELLGSEPISIGFWVGRDVTPNSYKDFLGDDIPRIKEAKRKISNQLLTCPFCGKPLDPDHAFRYNDITEEVEIYCEDKDCIFYKYPENGIDPIPMPIYLVDEQIYRRCPTVVLATVDKFARLPWDPKTNALFGRIDKKCSRHGYVALGEYHPYKHNETATSQAARCTPVKMFAPPELIVQDELHLITGPLGTIYGGYETLIEDLCSYEVNGKKIKPKYICSTATIKNADEQIKCLYGRKKTAIFPSSGLLIGDSYFIRDEPLETKPFRKYVGVCASGQSMKTTLLRTYAAILQYSFELSKDSGNADLIDPYYSLIGYFNSIRELGGTVRLLQDDIPKRMNRIRNRYKFEKVRPLFTGKQEEITSRINSRDIAKKLQKLETPFGNKDCIDTAVATNMIAVGMDVDRLGLMTVMGQPKLNSEYIQATSRIGRRHPGLVFTIYNPYRPRDLSHYENFTGYHLQLYRYVEGTTATPFSARARDRFIHAIIIAVLRMKYPDMASKPEKILDLGDDELNEFTKIIEERIQLINPRGKDEAMREIKIFISNWKRLAGNKKMKYSGETDGTTEVLMVGFEEKNKLGQSKSTLNSMREVESGSELYYDEGRI